MLKSPPNTTRSSLISALYFLLPIRSAENSKKGTLIPLPDPRPLLLITRNSSLFWLFTFYELRFPHYFPIRFIKPPKKVHKNPAILGIPGLWSPLSRGISRKAVERGPGVGLLPELFFYLFSKNKSPITATQLLNQATIQLFSHSFPYLTNKTNSSPHICRSIGAYRTKHPHILGSFVSCSFFFQKRIPPPSSPPQQLHPSPSANPTIKLFDYLSIRLLDSRLSNYPPTY